jgi:predicted TIM-barrel fold metal-dependent hydrolase
MPFPISASRRHHPVWDVDALVGVWPRARSAHLRSLREVMDRVPLAGATVGSLRAALTDAQAGNAEILATTKASADQVATVSVDLRNPLDLPQAIEAARQAGIRIMRLYPVWQNVGPTFPALRYALRGAAEAGLSVLMDGDVRTYHVATRDLGLDVVFLDTHAYHVADLILLGRDEPTVRTSTRLLNGPDSIARVVGELGAHRVLFGSRAPLQWTMPPLRTLQCSRISDEEYARVVYGNAAAMAGAK